MIDVGANRVAEEHHLQDRQRKITTTSVRRSRRMWYTSLRSSPSSACSCTRPPMPARRARQPHEQIVDRVDAELLLQLRRRAHRADASRRP